MWNSAKICNGTCIGGFWWKVKKKRKSNKSNVGYLYVVIYCNIGVFLFDYQEYNISSSWITVEVLEAILNDG